MVNHILGNYPRWEPLVIPGGDQVPFQTLLHGNQPLKAAVLATRPLVDDTIKKFCNEIFQPLLDDQPVTIVLPLNGSISFYGDLEDSLRLHSNCRIMPVKVQSIRADDALRVPYIIEEMIQPEDLQGRFVVILDDVYDTGWTFRALEPRLRLHSPIEVVSIVLADKRGPASYGRPDFALFRAHPDSWLIGRGMDLDSQHRQLPYLADTRIEGRYSKQGDILYRRPI